MAGSIRIDKIGEDWCIVVEGDDYAIADTTLTEGKVHDLVDQINNASLDGAPWGVFEELMKS